MRKNANSFGLAELLLVSAALFITPQLVQATTGTIDISTRYQVLEGFGASGAWYTNWLLAFPEPTRNNLYNIMFRDLGLDIYRVRNTHDQDNAPDEGPTYISNTGQIVAAAKARNPNIKIMISSWSPPGRLKSSGVINGGTLKKDPCDSNESAPYYYKYTAFAQWWADSLADFNSHGVFANYINMQNEPDFNSTGQQTCAFWVTENANYAGYDKAFRALYTKLNPMSNCPNLLVPEAMGMSLSSYYINALNSTDKSNVYGYAHHLYSDTGGSVDNPDGYISTMAWFASNYSDKPRMQTEFARLDSNTLTFKDAMNLAKLIHNSLTVENASAYLYWELFWQSPKGLVTFPSWGTYAINPVYYAFKQYSAFTDPNWQRVSATTDSCDLRISAYISPDSNHLTAVIINTSASTNITLSLSFNNIAVTGGEVYRTSQTENCLDVGSFDKTQPLVLDANSITTIAMTSSSDITPPAAPTGLSATASNKIVWLDWNDNNEPDLAGYNIYRSTTHDSNYSKLNTSLLTEPNYYTEVNYTDSSVTNGTTYYYVVTAVDTSTNESNYSSEASATPSTPVGAMGSILREWWLGISGGSVGDLTNDPCYIADNPTSGEFINRLEGPTNWADSYGQRISGYLYPPADGNYTFWIASDANSELWLSTDGNPENAHLIAEVNVPDLAPRQWDNNSQPQSLSAGKKYYIKVLHKADIGNDNVAVAWQGPGITPRQVIYGTYLSPWLIGPYGDFTHNGKVDMNDLADLTKVWLDANCQETSAIDVDGDCMVNFYEFASLAENWLKIIVPPPPTNLSITAASDTSVSLDWDNSPAIYLAGYNIYRSTTHGSNYNKLNSTPVTSSNYTDNTAANGVTYYYVVTAVDIYSVESAYSNEVCRLVIQESTTGFCGVDGSIRTTYSGYTGTGYADTDNYSGAGINWEISVPSSGTYTFTWRYASGVDQPARLKVDGSIVVSSIGFPSTGSWTTWGLESVDCNLTAGTRSIRLEATGANGGATGAYDLANIDYLMVTSTSASPSSASCP